MGRILVTGGAGYVGSHVVRQLVEQGEEVRVVDDLSTGHRPAVGTVSFVPGRFQDEELLDRELGGAEVECVIHMAAFSEIGVSVADPAAFYENNLCGGLILLEAMRAHGVRGMVFSSSAAVYGEPDATPIPESHPLRPTNPYGDTKLAFERALAGYARAYDMPFVSLRYFNAAGAHPAGDLGEDHDPESHLVPRLLAALHDDEVTVPIFGDDYPTPDGTCVRDFVHVCDLADAHVLALGQLRRGRPDDPRVFNLGNGAGFSVRHVLEAVERVTGRRPATRVAPRRDGDPAVLVASSALARERLGWQPRFSDLDRIVDTAWGWHRDRPRGYGDD